MRQYEILLILPAEADDALVGAVTDRLTGVIGRSGGSISKLDRWGRRRLAYEIDRATEGYYLLAEFAADPAEVRELDRVLALADEVIRFKVVVLPERRGRRAPSAHAVAENGASASAANLDEAPADAEPSAESEAPAEAEAPAEVEGPAAEAAADAST